MTKSDDKRVPVLRFKGFTDEWEQRKLGEVSKITAGGDVDKEKLLLHGKFPVIANALTNDGIVGYYNDTYRITAPAVTVTGRGEIGKAKARKNNFTPVVRLLAVESKHNVDFLAEAINRSKVVFESTGVPQLTVPKLSNYKILFPNSIDEEIEVGNFLSRFDSLITLQQRKLKLLKLMKNIVSYNLVVSHKLASNDEIKWKAVYLKDIARIYQPTTITKKDLLPKGIPVFGANDYIGFYNKYNHETDQVTICARGASAGHPNYVKGPVWITGNSMVINVDETYINKKFLYTLLTFTDLKRFVTGGAQPQITRENLNSLKILLPSIKAQNNLSAIIENLSINIRKVQLSINSAKRLKQFLLQNMFI